MKVVNTRVRRGGGGGGVVRTTIKLSTSSTFTRQGWAKYWAEV